MVWIGEKGDCDSDFYHDKDEEEDWQEQARMDPHASSLRQDTLWRKGLLHAITTNTTAVAVHISTLKSELLLSDCLH